MADEIEKVLEGTLIRSEYSVILGIANKGSFSCKKP